MSASCLPGEAVQARMGLRLGEAVRHWAESRKTAVPEEKRLSAEAVASLFIHFCFQFGASMSGVFLTLYLWRLTHSLEINGAYYAINYAVAPLAFALGGWMIKRKDRMVTYRMGIAMIALFYLSVVFSGERVAQYYVLFAVLNGIASSFYWVGYLTLMYDVTTDRNRIRFLAINMITFTLGGLIGPALAGFLIRQFEGLQGYTIVFGISFLMFLLAALGSFKIPMKASHHKAYYLKYVGLLMRKNRDWTYSLIAFLVMGLFQGLMLFLPNILLFQIVGREDLVGYLGVLYASLGIGTGMFISRYGTESKAKAFMFISTIGFVIGTAFILWKLTLGTIIAFMIIYSICAPLQGNTITSYYYRLIGVLPLKGQLRVESVVMRETFLNGGRVASIGLLVWLTSTAGSEVLPWVLAATAALQIGLVWLLNRRADEEQPQGEAPAVPGPGSESGSRNGMKASS